MRENKNYLNSKKSMESTDMSAKSAKFTRYLEELTSGTSGIDFEAAKPEPLLAVDDVARILKTSPGTIRNWTSNGRLPYRKIGRLVRYKLSDVMAFIEAGKRGLDHGY